MTCGATKMSQTKNSKQGKCGNPESVRVSFERMELLIDLCHSLPFFFSFFLASLGGDRDLSSLHYTEGGGGGGT
jgi:hypothetical protein